MPTRKKSAKRKKGKKQLKKKKIKKIKKTTVIKVKNGKKKVVFRGQTITLEEQYALEDLENELGRKLGKFTRIEYSQFGFFAHNGNVKNLEIRHVGLKKVPE